MHSAFNLVTTRLAHQWSIVAVETLVGMIGIVTLVIGLAMMGQL